MNITDYTQDKSTIVSPIMPSRFGSYLLDLLKLWFSDNRNIQANELKGLTYIDGDSEAAINGSSVFLDIEWPEDPKLSGKTPAVIISYGDAVISQLGVSIPTDSIHFPGKQYTKQVEYDISIAVRTAAYSGTQYLSELLFSYLDTFSQEIQKDSGISKFRVVQLSSPKLGQSPGDSKDVFMATIVCKAQSVFNVSVDTTGPVFRGLTFKS